MYIFLWVLICLTFGCVWVAQVTQNLIALHERFSTVKLMLLYYP